MLDIEKLRYRLIAITESGSQEDLNSVLQDLSWQETDGELASSASFTIKNEKPDGTALSSIIKLGCAILILADWGAGEQEMFRGTLNEWSPSKANDSVLFSGIAYDVLYNLSQSQDNRYIKKGTGTKAAISSICKDWGVPILEYKGPDIPHAKTLYKNQTLSDMILDLLDTASKKSGIKYTVRAKGNGVVILERGKNETIYHFDENVNLISVQDNISMANLVTRVKIVGKENKEGRSPVEALVDGQIEFGIRQQIYNRSEDDSLATAKQEAQAILKENGKPQRSITITTPDIPFLKKWDKIHVFGCTINGYCLVKSVSHSAAERQMTLEVDFTEATWDMKW